MPDSPKVCTVQEDFEDYLTRLLNFINFIRKNECFHSTHDILAVALVFELISELQALQATIVRMADAIEEETR